MSQTEELQRIYSELNRINNRLDKLEGKATSIPTESTRPAGIPAELPPQLPTASPPPSWSTSNYYSVPEAKASLSTGSVIGTIGIICFILGAALIVKMAADSGWLTPFRQWGLVGLLGIVMGGVGLFFKES